MWAADTNSHVSQDRKTISKERENVSLDSASLPVTVAVVHERCCEQRALHVVTQSLSSHLILTSNAGAQRPVPCRPVAASHRGDQQAGAGPRHGCVWIKNLWVWRSKETRWTGRVCVCARVNSSVWPCLCPFSIPLSSNAVLISPKPRWFVISRAQTRARARTRLGAPSSSEINISPQESYILFGF